MLYSNDAKTRIFLLDTSWLSRSIFLTVFLILIYGNYCGTTNLSPNWIHFIYKLSTPSICKLESVAKPFTLSITSQSWKSPSTHLNISKNSKICQFWLLYFLGVTLASWSPYESGCQWETGGSLNLLNLEFLIQVFFVGQGLGISADNAVPLD